MSIPEDLPLFDAIQKDDKQAFERIFRETCQPLTAYAFKFVRDVPAAENIVQDVFLKLWQNRHEMIITTSLIQYLFRSVRNHCLNFLDKSKVRNEYLKFHQEREGFSEDYSAFFPEIGLLDKIEAAISALPEKRQEIFRLAREEGLKYREIADRLNLSVKTVEAQMTSALKQLRESLKKYNPHLLFFMLRGKGNTKRRCLKVKG